MSYGFLLDEEEQETHICNNIHCSNYAKYYHTQLDIYLCQFCEDLLSYKIRGKKKK